mmetsp:Transcript_30714/g.47056  ORF Transcript_30714/g.47056 Transcript_30714/m.47056 type:complete len:81 (-) Transcript_30714:71-313(-)
MVQLHQNACNNNIVAFRISCCTIASSALDDAISRNKRRMILQISMGLESKGDLQGHLDMLSLSAKSISVVYCRESVVDVG